MSSAAEVVLTVVIFIGMCSLCFVGWIIWCVITGFYDHCLGHYKRIRNRRIDAAVGRNVYSFKRGVHFR